LQYSQCTFLNMEIRGKKMVNMTLVKSLMLFIFLTTNVLANTNSSEKTIEFTGQSIEELILENKLIETRYRTETQDSTCQREVPYQDQDCHMEPRYDEQCTTIPGRNDCRTEYDTRCHNETEYRQECHRGPSRQVCRNVRRTRQECTTGRATRECHREPAREQCRTNRQTGQRVCRNIPGREVCNSKPGRRTCRSVPYNDRVCETERGQRVCRQVPHTNRVCRDVPRQACDWIPSRQQCDTVQVGEDQVCVDVTRYRTEDYACTIDVQIPYEVTAKEFQANCTVKFNASKYKDTFSFKTLLDENGELIFKATDLAKTPVVFVKKKLTSTTSGIQETINAKIKMNIVDTESLMAKLYPVSEIELRKEKLTFSLPKQELTKSFKMFLRLKTEGNTVISRTLKNSELEVSSTDSNVLVTILMKDLGLEIKDFAAYSYAIKLSPIFKKELAFPLNGKLEYKTDGEIYPELSSDDLESFENELNQISLIELKTDMLAFNLPTHNLVEGFQVKLKLGSQIDKVLSREDFSIETTTTGVRVTIKTKDIDVDLSASKSYSVALGVEYFFPQESSLPEGYKFTATRSVELKPALSSTQLDEIKKDAESFKEFKFLKNSVAFTVNSNKYLTDMKVKVLIKYKSKLKLEKEFSMSELQVSNVDGESRVVIDIAKHGVKIARKSKYKVSLEVIRTVDSELSEEPAKVYSVSKSFHKRASRR
jgi:hypothetical protein